MEIKKFGFFLDSAKNIESKERVCYSVGEGRSGTVMKWMKKAEKSKWIPFFLLGLSLAMIGIGIFRGEVEIVLNKAVNICLECIGIG